MNLRKFVIEKFFYDKLFQDLEIDSVLDVGSGNGKMIDYFNSRGKDVTAIDLYPTREDILKMNVFENPFVDNSFDLVFSAHVIEHISNAEDFVKELLRVSNRYVCIITPYPTVRFWDQPDHIRPYTPETLRRICHTNRELKCFKMLIPFFEPLSIIVFEKKQSRIGGVL